MEQSRYQCDWLHLRWCPLARKLYHLITLPYWYSDGYNDVISHSHALVSLTYFFKTITESLHLSLLAVKLPGGFARAQKGTFAVLNARSKNWSSRCRFDSTKHVGKLSNVKFVHSNVHSVNCKNAIVGYRSAVGRRRRRNETGINFPAFKRPWPFRICSLCRKRICGFSSLFQPCTCQKFHVSPRKVKTDQ